MLRIEQTLTTTPKPHPADADLGFGRHFTDHMFRMSYTAGTGWHDARVVPYQPITLEPSAAVLHYGQEIFEGLKVFRRDDGALQTFRIDDHCRRFAVSGARMCIPVPTIEDTREAILALVRADASWVPSTQGSALYVRPTLIATEPFLGVRPANEYLFFVIVSPVGAYYAEGQGPVSLWIEERYSRAAPGGTGAAKTGGNYAASLLAASAAKERGYAQVLWLSGSGDARTLEEAGTMNLFVRFADEVVTPPLGDTILAGITRDSALTLLRHWGVPVRERAITLKELRDAHAKGTLKEAFGTGTAAVIAPIGELGSGAGKMKIGDGGMGELSRRLYDTLTGIQRGTLDDPFGWTARVT